MARNVSASRGREAVPERSRRHGDHRCRVVAEREGAALEIEGDGARPDETNFEHAFAEADRGAPRGEEGERRIDETLRKPWPTMSGWHARPPAPSVSRSSPAARAAEPSGGLEFRPASRSGRHRREQREIFAQRRSGRAPFSIEQPPWEAPFVEP